MKRNFAENLQRLRMEKGYTQQQLAKLVCVDRTSITRWETGSRVPDLILLARLADCLGVEPSALLYEGDPDARIPAIIMVDDERAILAGNMKILCETVHDAEITGFSKPSEALRFVQYNHVDDRNQPQVECHFPDSLSGILFAVMGHTRLRISCQAAGFGGHQKAIVKAALPGQRVDAGGAG